MPLFEYKIIQPDGKEKVGLLKASNLQAVRRQLESSKGLIVALRQKQTISLPIVQDYKEDLLHFTFQLSVMLRSGLPLYDSLLALSLLLNNSRFHAITVELGELVKKGHKLSESMARMPRFFPTIYIALVRSGECSGSLASTLSRLKDLLTNQLKLKRQLTSALLYPAFLLILCLIIMIILLTQTIPALENLMVSYPNNGIIHYIFQLSHFFINYKVFICSLSFLIIVGTFYIFKVEKVQKFIGKILFAMPLLGDAILHASISRFMWAMASLQESGFTIIESLHIAKDVISEISIRQGLDEVIKGVSEGQLLSVELNKIKFIPPLVIQLIGTAESRGNMTEIFYNLADLYQHSLERDLTRITILLPPVVLIMVGALMGFLFLSLMQPLTSLQSMF
ncbi:MAG: gspF [Chlamydiales bacterium]|jgi:general secretion pathway protein F/type IV pilus assembly protein PilC|nr:gspF [Chlamydiales bacterium]